LKKGGKEMKKAGTAVLVFTLLAFFHLGLNSSAWGQEKAKEAKPAPPPDFAIERAVVATGVENREPVGTADVFPASTERVYCFLEAKDISKPTEVSFVWIHGDQEMRKVNLPLPAGPRWRTWAYKNLGGKKGDWKVEIRDAAYNLMKEIKFKVE
jgi:hypothetical protein